MSYFLVGIGIGAVIGLLLAPKSGEETRNLIAEKTRGGAQWVTDRRTELGKMVQDVARATERTVDRFAKSSSGLAGKFGFN